MEELAKYSLNGILVVYKREPETPRFRVSQANYELQLAATSDRRESKAACEEQ